MSRTSEPGRAPREVYFEFHAIGRYVRVAAIDSVTGTEAIISGAVDTPHAELERIALRALERKLSGSHHKADKDESGPGRIV